MRGNLILLKIFNDIIKNKKKMNFYFLMIKFQISKM